MAATAKRHLAQVVAGDGRRGLAHLQTPVLGEVRDVHVRDGLLDRGREYALQRAERENPCVLACEVPLVLDLEVAWHSFAQCRQQAAQSLRDPDELPHGLGGSGGGDIDGEGHQVARQRENDLRRDLLARLVLRFGRAGTRCGVTTTRSSSNRGEDVHGSVEKHVERGTGDLPRSDGVGKRLLVDDAAASGISRCGCRASPLRGSSLPTSPMVSGDFGRWMLTKSALEKSSSRPRKLDPHLVRPIRGHVRVICDEPHPEAAAR